MNELPPQQVYKALGVGNSHGSNIHELDEGIGYRSLMDLRPDFYTVETIAAQVAKSPSYVKGRISLTLLIPAAQAAFYDGKLSVDGSNPFAPTTFLLFNCYLIGRFSFSFFIY